MAPRRNSNNHHSAGVVEVHNLIGFSSTPAGGEADHHNNNNNNNNNGHGGFESSATAVSQQIISTGQTLLNESNMTRCCVPSGECFLASVAPEFGLINLDDLTECVRVICNNENCTAGQYMHRECFESWEQSVLSSLKSIGRARSWSDRQRAQNLWTKKGYDLVFKACGCKCGRGHLKKDLDWSPPTNNNNVFGRADEESTKKKKKRNRNNQKPTLAIATINPGAYHPNSQINQNGNAAPTNGSATTELRGRASSLSSSSGSTSPPVSASSEHSISPVHHNNSNNMNLNHVANNGNLAPGAGVKTQLLHQLSQLTPLQKQQLVQQQKNKEVELYSERVRSTSGCNGIFSRRLDFSSFNLLPKTRLNSYQVKIEDEGNHGNDETRLFILSSLAQNQKSRVACVLCEEPMFVFDRYPLVDGSFFLSPKPYSAGCIEVKYDSKTQYLTAVCMGCLDGNSCTRGITCRFCGEGWNGDSLVLGTMYSYDIFAAMPCCAERLKCNNCFKLLLHPQQRLNNYSDYSRMVTCPYCAKQDSHFVKPLGYCYNKLTVKSPHQLA